MSRKHRDKEYLDQIRKSREETVRFFSNSKKWEREVWAVNEFLLNLGAEFSNYEISPSPTEPPDVLFREARFEVKEIMDEGRKRHDEVKKSLQQAIQAKKPEDLIESYSPRDIAFTEIYPIVKTRSQRLTSKYSADIRKTIDLLYYVNLEDVHGYISQPLPDMADLVLLGFRSISFVLGRHAGILTANSDAPILLTGYTPRIQRRG